MDPISLDLKKNNELSNYFGSKMPERFLYSLMYFQNFTLISGGHILYCPLPRAPKAEEMSSWRNTISETSQHYFHLQMNLYALSVASLSKGKKQSFHTFIQSSNTTNKKYISSFYITFFPPSLLTLTISGIFI